MLNTDLDMKLEIILDRPLLRRLESLLSAHDVSGWTVLPALSGQGQNGRWSRTGQIIDTGRMVLVIAVVRYPAKDELVKALRRFSGDFGALVMATPCHWIRKDETGDADPD